ncbi:MAG: hypothetical protein AABW84_00105 [Nanoarchaeota archaeon]
MKVYLLPVLLISIILVSGCTLPFINSGTDPGPNALYNKFNPTKYLKDWELVIVNKQVSDMPTDIRKDLLLEGVTDAAFWEFKKKDSEEIVRIWTKHIDDSEQFNQTQLRNYISTGSWRSETILIYADVGIVGVRKVNNANDPLMIYISKGQDMLYIFYYNRISDINGQPAYNGTNQGTDQLFLIHLTKDIAGIKNNVVTDAPEI